MKHVLLRETTLLVCDCMKGEKLSGQGMMRRLKCYLKVAEKIRIKCISLSCIKRCVIGKRNLGWPVSSNTNDTWKLAFGIMLHDSKGQDAVCTNCAPLVTKKFLFRVGRGFPDTDWLELKQPFWYYTHVDLLTLDWGETDWLREQCVNLRELLWHC